jgi:hypothetical protein
MKQASVANSLSTELKTKFLKTKITNELIVLTKSFSTKTSCLFDKNSLAIILTASMNQTKMTISNKILINKLTSPKKLKSNEESSLNSFEDCMIVNS